jgi:hypothetical protein
MRTAATSAYLGGVMKRAPWLQGASRVLAKALNSTADKRTRLEGFP